MLDGSAADIARRIEALGAVRQAVAKSSGRYIGSELASMAADYADVDLSVEREKLDVAFEQHASRMLLEAAQQTRRVEINI